MQLLTIPDHDKLLMCRYAEAQNALRQSLAIQDKPHARWLLGNALTELGQLRSAKAEYEAVVQQETASEAERTHATKQLAAIDCRMGQSQPTKSS